MATSSSIRGFQWIPAGPGFVRLDVLARWKSRPKSGGPLRDQQGKHTPNPDWRGLDLLTNPYSDQQGPVGL